MAGFINILLIEEQEEVERRNEFSLLRRNLRDASNPFSLEDRTFVNYYRLNKDAVRYLCNMLEPFMQEGIRRTKVPFHLRILASLHFFGNGSYQKSVSKDLLSPMSQPQICRAIDEVCTVLMTHFMNEISFSSSIQDAERTKRGFFEKFGYPGVVGAIDCTHVHIVPPNTNDIDHPPLAYVNRKGRHSINVQILCDSNLKIIGLDSRFPGSVHDSAIWRMSSIQRYFSENFNRNDNKWIIGDSGYPLQPWLITPILDAEEGTPEARFNNMHISARNTIERCIGVFKAIFRCLRVDRVLHYHPVKAGKIIYSCAILYNLRHRFGNDDIQVEIEENEHVPNANDENYNLYREGVRARQQIIRNVFG